MTFNVSKCKCMVISRKRNVNTPSLTLNSSHLEVVECYKYLGLLLSSDFSWSSHIEAMCAKVRRLLGLLYRQFSINTNPHVMAKLYLVLIRPHLEYGAQVWHPHLVKHTNAIENVQKFALRICSRKWNYSYRELLDLFQLPTLENRRLFLSLSTFFKIVYNLTFFPPHHLPAHCPSSSLRHSHHFQYYIPHTHTNQFKHSFMPTCISLWNNLPLESVSCTTYSSFKSYTVPLFS